MRIAICEDQEFERATLQSLLEAELAKRTICGEIIAFDSGEAMLAAMRNEVFPINFLDIYMTGITGVDVAMEIRAQSQTAAIVFTTTSREHMADGYTVGAVHYLLKPYEPASIKVALDRCLRAVGTPERYIEITAGGEKRKLFLSQIRWVESQDKSCNIMLQDERLRVYMRLDVLLAQLADPRFLRCHKSFLVNLDHAISIQNSDFVMTDGTLIPIRREDKAEIRKHYQTYNFEKMRSALERA